MSVPEAIVWQDERLQLLDQRALPQIGSYLAIDDIPSAVDAIVTLAVRGAPAIGIAAAYALASSMRNVRAADFAATLRSNGETLINARPTAVNLRWAVERLWRHAEAQANYAALRNEAERIHAEDRLQCQRIGEHGLPLISQGANVLTHCNAGSLAVSMLGTATAPLYLAHQANKNIHVFVDETRPLLQGARLTAWELTQAGVPATLICDNMAASLMADGRVDLVIVGTDRVARNGDVANKIGTLGVAVLARHYGIPFYVACPYSTIDFDTPNGTGIPIEERGSDEVTSFGSRRTGPDGIRTRNPAFDVTPAELVTGIITEQGMLNAPLAESMAKMYTK